MKKICVIGAGPSGIAAAKNILQAGITDFIVYEKSNFIGGNWVYSETNEHSSVFETTHILSSKPIAKYEDYPMPDYFPDYPSQENMYQYFNEYAHHFKILDYIQFNTSVEFAKLNNDNIWELKLSNGEVKLFENLIVANGHHWFPKFPNYNGNFNGRYIHSHDYKNNSGFENKKILIIGGGNSACDIAVETSRVSKKTVLSMRRGYYFIPKILMGKPVDQLNDGVVFIPKFIKRKIFKLLLRLSVGTYKDYGFQKPDHELFESYPIINSELLYFIKHGKIKLKVDVKYFNDKTVHFNDGSNEQFDVIIACTGYKIILPFFKKSFVNFENGDVRLYKKIFHPTYNNLFFTGLIQPNGCIWPLSDLQSQLIVKKILGQYKLPTNLDKLIDKEIKKLKSEYVNTPRHTIRVDFYEYKKELKKELK